MRPMNRSTVCPRRLRRLTFGSVLLLDRLLMQAVRQSPVECASSRRHQAAAIDGRGPRVHGHGVLGMYRLTGDIVYRDKGASCLDWLYFRSCSRFEDSWANHFGPREPWRPILRRRVDHRLDGAHRPGVP